MAAVYLSALSGLFALAGALFRLHGALSAACCLLAALCAALAAVCALLARRRGIRRLDQIRKRLDDFQHQGIAYDVPLEEDSLAALEQSLAQLCRLVSKERENSARQARQTAGLIADIAHQWRTPLSALRLYCELDQQTENHPRSQKQLAVIERMEAMIESLLRLEKLRAHTYEMHFAPTDIRALCDRICGELSPLFPEKRFILPEDPYILRCDGQWLGEALSNVLKNACQHTAASGVIRLDCRRHGRYAWIIVEDDGGGVAESALPRLFDRFYRPPGSASEGLGMGLAIAKAICQSHRGEIIAQNTGSGLRVSLLLPQLEDTLRQSAE